MKSAAVYYFHSLFLCGVKCALLSASNTLPWGRWIYLQVKELQAVQLVEEVVGESGQLAAVHVQALQLLQTPERPTFQSLQRVIPQIQLLQHPEVTEGSTLDPGDVVAIQPKHLHRRRRRKKR